MSLPGLLSSVVLGWFSAQQAVVDGERMETDEVSQLIFSMTITNEKDGPSIDVGSEILF